MSDLELEERYEKLIKEYADTAKKVADELERFGRLRNELEVLTVKLKKQDAPTDPK